MKYHFNPISWVFSNAKAQNILSGKVTDSKRPVVGVSVYAPELHKGTTRCRWNYTISNLPVGSLKLVFEYVGYANNLKLSCYS
jgi:iron complex outermembrane receptor protein